MKFRRRLFWGLALLSLVYIIGTLALASDTRNESVDECIAGGSTRALCESAADVGTGIGAVAVLCIGGGLFVVFALLAWRNGAGLATERRHQEQLEAAKRA